MITTSGQPLALTFKDPADNPIALGTLTLRLGTDGSSSDKQINAGVLVKIALNSSGSMSQNITPNSVISPANTTYFAKVYTAAGQLVWQEELSLTA